MSNRKCRTWFTPRTRSRRWGPPPKPPPGAGRDDVDALADLEYVKRFTAVHAGRLTLRGGARALVRFTPTHAWDDQGEPSRSVSEHEADVQAKLAEREVERGADVGVVSQFVL
jgi:hypothetical protein